MTRKITDESEWGPVSVALRLNKSTHVALFIGSLNGGGAERVIVNLANGFFRSGVRVDLILAQAKGPYLKDVSGGVRLVDLGVKHLSLALPGLVKYLRKERPHALLSALDYENLVAAVAGKLSGGQTRVVLSVHNTLTVAARHSRKLKGRMVPWISRLVYPYADAVVGVSKGTVRDLTERVGLRPDLCHAIYNPIVSPGLKQMASEQVDLGWFRPGAPPVLIAVGRFTPQKDFPTLVRSFALVREELDVNLVILGEGEDRVRVAELVHALNLQEHVLMPGFVANPYAYMSRAAALVVSSKWEGFCNVIPEALALGVPVVSTNCESGPAEILGGGQWGRLVPVNDPRALSDAISETLRERPNKGSLLKRSDDFTIDAAVKQYLEILTPANPNDVRRLSSR